MSKSKCIVIPVKTNNLRLPGKNTKLLNGIPLYDYMFKTVKKCKNVDKIYVDSSDDTILEIAKKNNFTTIKRPESLNGPDTSGNDLLNFELQTIKEDIICQTFVTLPFLKHTSIDNAFEKLEKESDKDSIIPLYEVYDRFWYEDINKKEKITPVNHDLNNLVGTQYMNPMLRESGFYIFKRQAFIKEKKRVTNRFTTIIIPHDECIDIDEDLDFIYAEAYAKYKKL